MKNSNTFYVVKFDSYFGDESYYAVVDNAGFGNGKSIEDATRFTSVVDAAKAIIVRDSKNSVPKTNIRIVRVEETIIPGETTYETSTDLALGGNDFLVIADGNCGDGQFLAVAETYNLAPWRSNIEKARRFSSVSDIITAVRDERIPACILGQDTILRVIPTVSAPVVSHVETVVA